MSSWLLQLAYAAAVASGQVPATCRSCHQRIVDSFTRTAHARTTTQAGAATIKADFSAGHNIPRTRAPGVWFRMERRADGFYETGFDSATGASRTERIDLVVGSGKRGQTYLYWRNGLLYELPVSYLTGARQWINSPGYIDGQIDFGRVIVPRCLECHSTMFAPARDARVLRYSSDYRLGVSCEKCHGDGRQHVKNRTAGAAAGPPDIYNPARASRDRQVDVCALCHSGRREQRRAPFAFRPGDRLDAFLFPEADDAAPDVHGNQVGLLRRSKCYRSSPAMSCATCHDVHQTQRRGGVHTKVPGVSRRHAASQCRRDRLAADALLRRLPHADQAIGRAADQYRGAVVIVVLPQPPDRDLSRRRRPCDAGGQGERQLRRLMLLCALLALAALPPARAQRLGTIDFPTSGAPAAQGPFIRGVLWLHSFEYEAAAAAFREAERLDPGFAMAYWGEALGSSHPVWNQQGANAARAALARLAPTTAGRRAKARTPREQAYLAAVETLYGSGSKAHRDTLYAKAMERLRARVPRDWGTQRFYAGAAPGAQPGVPGGGDTER